MAQLKTSSSTGRHSSASSSSSASTISSASTVTKPGRLDGPSDDVGKKLKRNSMPTYPQNAVSKIKAIDNIPASFPTSESSKSSSKLSTAEASYGPSRNFIAERQRTYSNLNHADLVKLLINQEYESGKTRKLLNAALAQVDSSSKRVIAAEEERFRLEKSRVLQTTEMSQMATQAQEKLSEAQIELGLTKWHLEKARDEATRAKAAKESAEKQKREAEKAARKAKKEAIKLQEERMILEARERGRKEGFDEGLQKGRMALMAQEQARFLAYKQMMAEQIKHKALIGDGSAYIEPVESDTPVSTSHQKRSKSLHHSSKHGHDERKYRSERERKGSLDSRVDRKQIQRSATSHHHDRGRTRSERSSRDRSRDVRRAASPEPVRERSHSSHSHYRSNPQSIRTGTRTPIERTHQPVIPSSLSRAASEPDQNATLHHEWLHHTNPYETERRDPFQPERPTPPPLSYLPMPKPPASNDTYPPFGPPRPASRSTQGHGQQRTRSEGGLASPSLSQTSDMTDLTAAFANLLNFPSMAAAIRARAGLEDIPEVQEPPSGRIRPGSSIRDSVQEWRNSMASQPQLPVEAGPDPNFLQPPQFLQPDMTGTTQDSVRRSSTNSSSIAINVEPPSRPPSASLGAGAESRGYLSPNQTAMDLDPDNQPVIPPEPSDSSASSGDTPTQQFSLPPGFVPQVLTAPDGNTIPLSGARTPSDPDRGPTPFGIRGAWGATAGTYSSGHRTPAPGMGFGPGFVGTTSSAGSPRWDTALTSFPSEYAGADGYPQDPGRRLRRSARRSMAGSTPAPPFVVPSGIYQPFPGPGAGGPGMPIPSVPSSGYDPAPPGSYPPRGMTPGPGMPAPALGDGRPVGSSSVYPSGTPGPPSLPGSMPMPMLGDGRPISDSSQPPALGGMPVPALGDGTPVPTSGASSATPGPYGAPGMPVPTLGNGAPVDQQPGIPGSYPAPNMPVPTLGNGMLVGSTPAFGGGSPSMPVATLGDGRPLSRGPAPFVRGGPSMPSPTLGDGRPLDVSRSTPRQPTMPVPTLGDGAPIGSATSDFQTPTQYPAAGPSMPVPTLGNGVPVSGGSATPGPGVGMPVPTLGDGAPLSGMGSSAGLTTPGSSYTPASGGGPGMPVPTIGNAAIPPGESAPFIPPSMPEPTLGNGALIGSSSTAGFGGGPGMPQPTVPSMGTPAGYGGPGMPQPTIPSMGTPGGPGMPQPTVSSMGTPAGFGGPGMPQPRVPSMGTPAGYGGPGMPLPRVSSMGTPAGYGPGMPLPTVPSMDTPAGFGGPGMPQPTVGGAMLGTPSQPPGAFPGAAGAIPPPLGGGYTAPPQIPEPPFIPPNLSASARDEDDVDDFDPTTRANTLANSRRTQPTTSKKKGKKR